jgi:hypothetical protein
MHGHWQRAVYPTTLHLLLLLLSRRCLESKPQLRGSKEAAAHAMWLQQLPVPGEVAAPAARLHQHRQQLLYLQ